MVDDHAICDHVAFVAIERYARAEVG